MGESNPIIPPPDPTPEPTPGVQYALAIVNDHDLALARLVVAMDKLFKAVNGYCVTNETGEVVESFPNSSEDIATVLNDMGFDNAKRLYDSHRTLIDTMSAPLDPADPGSVPMGKWEAWETVPSHPVTFDVATKTITVDPTLSAEWSAPTI